MPAYGAVASPVALYAGDEVTLWNAESPAAGTSSIAVSLAAHAGSPSPAELAISISYGSAPTAQIQVQGANDDADASYTSGGLPSSANTSPDLLQFSARAQFLRVNLVSQSGGGAITVKVRRAA